jgi:hypothetical protein
VLSGRHLQYSSTAHRKACIPVIFVFTADKCFAKSARLCIKRDIYIAANWEISCCARNVGFCLTPAKNNERSK